jgi:hypothetical protein
MREGRIKERQKKREAKEGREVSIYLERKLRTASRPGKLESGV